MARLDGSETVLCMPRADFDRLIGRVLFRPPVGCEGRFRDPGRQCRLIEQTLRACVPRPRTIDLELDPGYKQAVVYVVLRHRDSARSTTTFGVYRRPPGAGDERLDGRLSLGFAGHVAAPDWEHVTPPWSAVTLLRAVRRELMEELGSDPGAPACSYAGLVNDDREPTPAVGAHHFGFVYVVDVEDPAALAPRGEVDPVGWETPCEVAARARRREPFESWSAILAPELFRWTLGSREGLHRVLA